MSTDEVCAVAAGVPALSLDSDDFTLFGLPRRHAQDRADIDQRWKDLQRQAHPDRFAAGDAAARREAMQWSVRINEAHQRLKDPLRRAGYLCELAGVPVGAHTNTAMPAEFLLRQMAWREALDEAGSAAELRELQAQVREARQHTEQQVARLLDVDGDARAAAAEVRAWMFIERFAHDVEDRLDALDA